MKRQHWTAVALLSLLPLLSLAQNNDVAKKELARLQGTWKLVSIESDGKETTLEEGNVLRNWVIKGKTAINARVKLELDITIDPSTTPKLIDLTNKQNGQVLEGIYELKNNRWRICFNGNAGLRERPLEFATRDKAGYSIAVLEKEVK